MELTTNVLRFKDGEHVVPLWMLDHIYIADETELLAMTWDEFRNSINKKIENDTIEEIIVEKLGFLPARRF